MDENFEVSVPKTNEAPKSPAPEIIAPSSLLLWFLENCGEFNSSRIRACIAWKVFQNRLASIAWLSEHELTIQRFIDPLGILLNCCALFFRKESYVYVNPETYEDETPSDWDIQLIEDLRQLVDDMLMRALYQKTGILYKIKVAPNPDPEDEETRYVAFHPVTNLAPVVDTILTP